jgi:divalent metal cation (Fe/Co/Zn/Cd) transporter
MRESTFLFPALLVVLFLEAPAGFVGDRLAVSAHIFDVGSDVLAFLIVAVGAAFSGLLDDHGRVHKDLHREQKVIALISLLILWVGATLVLWRSVESFGEVSPERGWKDWWVIIGPLLAVFVYFWVSRRLESLAKSDLTAASLDAHVKGDVLVSIVVLVLTLLSLIIHNGWINQVGGLAMSAILFYVSWELIEHIRDAQTGVLTKHG